MSIHVEKVDRDFCPACGTEFNAAGALTGDCVRKPQEGDISICFKCLSVLVFDKEGKTYLATQEHWAATPAETKLTILEARDRIKAMRAKS